MSSSPILPIAATAICALDDDSLLARLHAAHLDLAWARAARREADSTHDLARAHAMLAAVDEKNAQAREARVALAAPVISARTALNAAEQAVDCAAGLVDVLTYAVRLRRRDSAPL